MMSSWQQLLVGFTNASGCASITSLEGFVKRIGAVKATFLRYLCNGDTGLCQQFAGFAETLGLDVDGHGHTGVFFAEPLKGGGGNIKMLGNAVDTQIWGSEVAV